MKHGDARKGKRPGEYTTWRNMRTRCYDPKCPEYHNYGGRGITICDQWRHDYAAFLAYMGRKPSPEYSVDRIDKNGNYEPGNVRWADKTTQSRNRRNNVLVVVNGIEKTLAEAAPELNIEYDTIKSRILRGWDKEEAVATPTILVQPPRYGSENPHWKGGPKTLVCEMCKNAFQVHPGAKRRFCSRPCLANWQREAFAGPNSPRWMGGRGETMKRYHGKKKKPLAQP